MRNTTLDINVRTFFKFVYLKAKQLSIVIAYMYVVDCYILIPVKVKCHVMWT